MVEVRRRSLETAAYLDRLEVDLDAPPTVETLFEIHHRHLERIPYENLHIMLGRPPATDPVRSLTRIGGRGRAGYCFHHNGALELVLRELGYSVERRHGHVYTDQEHRFQPGLSHLVLVVDGRWWPDVGLGDGFHDPLPLTSGVHEQGGFAYALEIGDDGWSFRHDPAGSFTGLEVTRGAVDAAAVEEGHRVLSTPPEGAFTRKLVVQRRDASGVDTVRGCLLLRAEPGSRTEVELASYDDWRAALVDVLHLALDDAPEDELRALFGRQLDAHREWTAAGRP